MSLVGGISGESLRIGGFGAEAFGVRHPDRIEGSRSLDVADGQLGVQAARELTQRLRNSQCDVLFDHGDTTKDPARYVGNISSWFGKTYSTSSQLALLDIAVVDRSDDRAMVLVEIDETSSNQKTIIGDAFGTILGDHITFQGVRHLSVGDYTALLVLLRNRPEKKRQ